MTLIGPRQALGGPDLHPMLCVGGPAHGQMIDHPMKDYLNMPVYPIGYLTEFGMDFHEDVRTTQKMMMAQYERDRVAIMFGKSAYFEAVIWRWHQMKKEDAATAALGLLLASAMMKESKR